MTVIGVQKLQCNKCKLGGLIGESLDISYMGLKIKRDVFWMQKVVVVGGGSSDMKKIGCENICVYSDQNVTQMFLSS